MKQSSEPPFFTTGIDQLDALLDDLRPGDNMVWHLDSIDTFIPISRRFSKGAADNNRRLIYFRFSDHSWLVPYSLSTQMCRLIPRNGFERFIMDIRTAIDAAPPSSIFLFDLISHLTRDFNSERMLEYMFKLICPLISDSGHLAIFPILKDFHPFSTAHPIEEHASVSVDLFTHGGDSYIQVRKVVNRQSEFMYMIHRLEEETLTPLVNSTDTVDALQSLRWAGLQSASYRMIPRWDRPFMHAEELIEQHERGEVRSERLALCARELLPDFISRDERICALFEQHVSLPELIYLWKRTIGTGLIGGKSAGMLLSRAIVHNLRPEISQTLEPHDSFFVATDVFYDFLVRNDCWWIRIRQQNSQTMFDDAHEIENRIMSGSFPPDIVARFSDMLDYFGQMPVIVRSSSLLEDAYGNAFAGQYDSVFCTNQGTRQARLEEFMNAVKTVYASSMKPGALAYRQKRGILQVDEQMAVLVQRVSGTRDGGYFFPHLAGVGLSYNPYIWNPDISPEAGVLRLVVGLGTRAVDRHDDDHTRVVALNLPEKPPQGGPENLRHYAQRKVDVMDLRENKLSDAYFVDLTRRCPALPVQQIATVDEETLRRQIETGREGLTPWLIDFHRVFSHTPFVERMREILSALKEAYGTEVEMEFTATLTEADEVRINLVQCRPFQMALDADLPHAVPASDRRLRNVLECHGAILGKSRSHAVGRVVYVDPAAYSALAEQDRYEVARIIGELTHLENGVMPNAGTVLIGPGRWGTRMPSLGVPITSSELGNTCAICEMDIMHDSLIPDLSLGTHFFHELVESNILYIGWFKSNPANRFDELFFSPDVNVLARLLPARSRWSQVLRVVDATPAHALFLRSDLIEQQAALYVTTL